MHNYSSNSTMLAVDEENTITPTATPSRRQSIFKPNVASVFNDDIDETVREYRKKVTKEYRNWRELYVDVKNEYSALKDANSKPAEDATAICSESYQELLAKAENYLKKSNEFFDEMACISTMNQSSIKSKQLTTLKLEQQAKMMEENLGKLHKN